MASVINGLSPEDIQKLNNHSASSIFSMFPAAADATEMSKMKNGATASSVFHNYSSETLIIWGSADAEKVKQKIEGPWQPVTNAEGKALVSLWAIKYRSTVVNPYTELVLVLMVNHKSQPALQCDTPQQRLQKYDDKEAFPYIYKLWLDEELPVNYGRELLGCDKYIDPAMKMDCTPAGWTTRAEIDFEFHHMEGEINGPTPGLMLKGKLSLADGMGLGGLIGAYGLMRTLSMAGGAQNNWHLVNAPGVIEQSNMSGAPEGATPQNCNPIWDMYYETSPKFSEASPEDDIEYGGELKEIDFAAEMYQHDPNFKAVLLAPWHYELQNSEVAIPKKPTDCQAPKQGRGMC